MSARLIRLRDVPQYLGMDKNRFNAEVRPSLIDIPIGKQGIAFDKFALDAWVDQYIQRNGRPGVNLKRRHPWQDKKFQGLKKSAISGTSTKELTAAEFVKALDQVVLKKQKNT